METYAVVFFTEICTERTYSMAVSRPKTPQAPRAPSYAAKWKDWFASIHCAGIGTGLRQLVVELEAARNIAGKTHNTSQTMHPCLGITFPVTDLQITTTPERPRNSPNQCQTCFCIHLSLLCERNQWLHVISPLGLRRCCDVHMKHLVAFHSASNTHSCHRKGAKLFLCTNTLERMW